MPFSLIPGQVLDSIYHIAPEDLRAQGITLVLADLDNTLVPYEQSLPSPELVAWKQALEDAGVALFVVSNSRKSRRCPRFCEALGVECVRHAGKPGTRGFAQALERTGRRAEECVMVGDQIFTDTLGANRAGIRSILVRPMAWGKNPGRILRYALEAPFRLAGRRKDRA